MASSKTQPRALAGSEITIEIEKDCCVLREFERDFFLFVFFLGSIIHQYGLSCLPPRLLLAFIFILPSTHSIIQIIHSHCLDPKQILGRILLPRHFGCRHCHHHHHHQQVTSEPIVLFESVLFAYLSAFSGVKTTPCYVLLARCWVGRAAQESLGGFS